MASGTAEKLELITYLHKISNSLNNTIEYLNELIKVNTITDLPRVKLKFQKKFQGIADVLSIKSNETQTVIKADFYRWRN